LNTHGVRGKHLYQTPDWTKTLATMKQIIFQWDGHNNENVEKWSKAGLGVPLFDTSSGAGVLPGSWPKAVEGVYCGYAGGLGPANVVDQLKTIEPATNGQPFWIDMETRVRSSKDRLFDLAKVIDVLEKCEPFVMKD
jgi:phosphoribosylanthranilate isomerase